MSNASEAATTGSRATPLAHLRESKPRINVGVLREADITPRMRLLAHYMVFGVDHPSLAAKITRTRALLDPQTGKHISTEPVAIELGEPLTLEEAALLCNVRRRFARRLAQQPTWQRILARETEAFRNSAKPRALRRIDKLAHEPGDGSAAWAKVNHQAATYMHGEQAGKGSGTTVNVGVNVGIAGYVIDLSPQPKQPADAPAIEHGDSSE